MVTTSGSIQLLYIKSKPNIDIMYNMSYNINELKHIDRNFVCIITRKDNIKREVSIMNTFDKRIIGFTDLRNNLSSIIDKVINQNQEMLSGNVKKSYGETVSIIPTKLLDEILDIYEFKPEINYDENTGQYEILVKEIEAEGFGDTLKEAIETLMDNVIALVDDYFEDLNKYIIFDKYKKQYPYYMKLKHCNSEKEMLKVLNIDSNK